SRGWWVNAEGGRGDIDDTTNASGADYRFTGLTVGFDAPVSEELHLGAAMGYTRNRGDTAGGDIDVDSIHLAAYGGWQRDALYARGSVGMAYHRTDTERFVDTVGQTAEADYSARGVGMRAEGGYTFEIGNTARLTPFGGLDYEYLRRSGFSESGAGAANLDVNRESEYSLRSQAGVRFDQAFETTGGWVAPYAEAAWVHEHGDRSSRMDTAFAADTATRFTIEGPRLSRDRVRVAAGLDARLNADSFLNVGYQGEIASSDDLHAIGLTFRRNW
uniref:autotransporter outer membrane beta-barrel domain-containing protein n=1 Tax=Thioalkalivibrio sp. ALE19 TaxID=1266909 RepID=UPI00048BD97E